MWEQPALLSAPILQSRLICHPCPIISVRNAESPSVVALIYLLLSLLSKSGRSWLSSMVRLRLHQEHHLFQSLLDETMNFQKNVRHHAKQGQHDHADHHCEGGGVSAQSAQETHLEDHVRAQPYDKEDESFKLEPMIGLSQTLVHKLCCTLHKQ